MKIKNEDKLLNISRSIIYYCYLLYLVLFFIIIIKLIFCSILYTLYTRNMSTSAITPQSNNCFLHNYIIENPNCSIDEIISDEELLDELKFRDETLLT